MLIWSLIIAELTAGCACVCALLAGKNKLVMTDPQSLAALADPDQFWGETESSKNQEDPDAAKIFSLSWRSVTLDRYYIIHLNERNPFSSK